MKNFPGIAWRVVTVDKPVIWPRTSAESWLLVPPWRYIVTSDQQPALEKDLESFSDLKNSTFYKPLSAAKDLSRSRILVCRHYDRGIGDMLFVTGPVSYIQHMNLHSVQIYWHAPAEKGQVLHGNPDLKFEMPISGPVLYDVLPSYRYHWFIESASEYDEEPEQENVYDVLFKQIGVDPDKVDPKFKRPKVKATVADSKRVDEFFRLLYFERSVDWRKIPYVVVSPLTISSLRSLNYVTWLSIIEELAKSVNVLVIGQAPNNIAPDAGISFAEFHERLGVLSSQKKEIINLIGRVPMRLAMGLLLNSAGLVTLDSGLLYVAQGLRVPAISIWGPQHPKTRIGYDPSYMDLAIWKPETCPAAPCFAYREFPKHKCVQGENQKLCEPLSQVRVEDVMVKVEKMLKG
jgi:ADP-heptose:LPS heptosyltransferase